MATPTGFPELSTMLINIGSVLPSIIGLMQGFAALIGLYLVASALIEIWGVSNDNAMKYVSAKQKFSIPSALIQLVVGGIFASISTLEFVGVLSRTITGDYANSRFVSYGAADGTALAQSQAAMHVLLGILQVIGLSALMKAVLTFNRYHNAQGNASLPQSFSWLIGGFACWNFAWVAQIINNTVGFEVINLLGAT